MVLQAPIDYTIQAIDPFTAGMAGFQMGMNRQAEQQAMEGEAQRQGLVGVQAQRDTILFDQAQQDRQAAIEEAAAAAEKEQAMTQAMIADQNALYEKIAAGTATAQDFTGFALKYPSLSDELKAPFESYTKERKNADIFELGRAGSALKAGRPDIAVKLLEDRAVAMENAGDMEGAEQARAMIAQVEMDPTAALTLVGITMKSLGADDELTAVFGAGAGRKVQSTIDLGGGLTATVFADGSKEVTDATGQPLEGQAAVDAIKAAEDRDVELKRLGAAGMAEGKLLTESDLADDVERAKARGRAEGKAAGEDVALYESLKSKLPGLELVVEELGKVADEATYTSTGRALDAGIKELGLKPRDAAVARSRYIAMVDNQVLPILRDTFGAAFTVKEGETLRATLGDPNKTPAEKKEVLRAFIQQKRRDLEALAKRTGVVEAGAPSMEAPAQFEIGDRAENPETGEELEFDGTQWVPVK